MPIHQKSARATFAFVRFELLGLVFAIGTTAFAAEEASPGQKIYQEKCFSCHGKLGFGTEKHPKPLFGDLSVKELTQVIDTTMPEGNPDSVNAEQSAQVAAYIHEEFYSPRAQARVRPARIELSRLTARQHQQSIADLVASIRNEGPANWDRSKLGLKATYFNRQHFNPKEKVIERTDEVVKFDYGTTGPVEGLDGKEFCVRWTGSIFVPETGEYEFKVETPNSCSLWINGNETALIDARVKSVNEVEHTASLVLLGGQVYPIRLEMTKGPHGVEDQKKKMETKSWITLSWKVPRRTWEVIPNRCLSTESVRSVYVVSTKFPPDDRSVGYERGTFVSEEWNKAAVDAALEVATFLSGRVERWSGIKSDDPKQIEKLKGLCYRFTERAFRHPLTADEKALYVDRQFEGMASPEQAVKRSVLLTLVSPRFLYVDESSPEPDQYTLAARLALWMWDSIPDQGLLQAAAKGQLKSVDQIRGQAKRMSADLRAQAKSRQFFMQWLKVDQIAEIAKDKNRFAEFTPELVSDLRTSLDLFLEEISWSNEADFRQIFLATEIPLNGRLAKFYGTDLPADAPFQKVALEPGERAGVLTHPLLLANFAYHAESSPIHRGVFLSRAMLGRALRPAPAAVAPTPADLQPNLTTRERVVAQTRSDFCMNCHAMINPLGFSLENFDAVGRFRKLESGKPIDAKGIYLDKDGDEVKFNGIRDLAKYLSESDEPCDALVEQLFQYIVKQPIQAYGEDQLRQLSESFRKGGFHFRPLYEEIAVMATLPKPKNQTPKTVTEAKP